MEREKNECPRQMPWDGCSIQSMGFHPISLNSNNKEHIFVVINLEIELANFGNASDGLDLLPLI
jgi:hypothetical protein